jgi:hypothetical protein
VIKLQPQSSLEEPSWDSDSVAVEKVITAFLDEFSDALRPLSMSDLKVQSSLGHGLLNPRSLIKCLSPSVLVSAVLGLKV